MKSHKELMFESTMKQIEELKVEMQKRMNVVNYYEYSYDGTEDAMLRATKLRYDLAQSQLALSQLYSIAKMYS